MLQHYIKQYARAFEKTDRNMWNYEDGCVLIGLEALYEATGDSYFLDAIRVFIDRYIDSEGTIRLYRMEEYNIDFIPSGRVLFLLHQKTGDEKYRHAAEHLMTQLRRQPRTQTSSFWHKAIYPNQVWLDGLYMGMPFYMQYENKFGDGHGYTDIKRQFENVRTYLWDEKEHLHYHAWDESRKAFWADKETGLSSNFWSRAIGWHLCALADVYALWQSDEEGKGWLRKLWVEAMDGMLSHRDAQSGLFYQLTALPKVPGNYLETSASLMVAYSLYKGIRLGVFSQAGYLGIAEEIICAVETRQMHMENGALHLGGICKGAGLGPEGNMRRDGSIAYYLDEDIVEDEQKGVGVLMMTVAERIKLNAQRPIDSPSPRVEIFMKEYDLIMPEDIARAQALKR